MKKLSLILLILAPTLLALACGGGGPARGGGGGSGTTIGVETLGHGYTETELSETQRTSLGSARVTFRQYPLASVRGANGSRPTDRKETLVNLGHENYDEGSNEKLKRDEFFISDSVMLQLLNALKSAGYFQRNNSNVRIINSRTTLEAYAKSLGKVYKWIAVEHKGKTYMIVRGGQEHLSAQEARWVKTFNACEIAILRASNNKLPKATVREVTREDLENSASTPGRR